MTDLPLRPEHVGYLRRLALADLAVAAEDLAEQAHCASSVDDGGDEVEASYRRMLAEPIELLATIGWPAQAVAGVCARSATAHAAAPHRAETQATAPQVPSVSASAWEPTNEAR